MSFIQVRNNLTWKYREQIQCQSQIYLRDLFEAFQHEVEVSDGAFKELGNQTEAHMEWDVLLQG